MELEVTAVASRYFFNFIYYCWLNKLHTAICYLRNE
jgi:hypothetical protein